MLAHDPSLLPPHRPPSGRARRVPLFARVAEREVEYAAQGRSPHALALATGSARASVADMERRYGVDLDASSHGQSFLRVFQSRFAPGGLYLLDEPEARRARSSTSPKRRSRPRASSRSSR